MELHKAELARLSAPPPQPPGPYGDVFTTGNLARYEFWPARESTMPLLAFCARQLLAGAKVSTTSNERMHSPGEKILCALRSRLKPATTEMLVLGHFFVRQDAKEKLLKWELETARMNEAQKEASLEAMLGKIEEEIREAQEFAAAELEAAKELKEDVMEDMTVIELLEGEEEEGEEAAAGAAAAGAAAAETTPPLLDRWRRRRRSCSSSVCAQSPA